MTEPVERRATDASDCDSERPPMPRWVRTSLIVLAVLVLVAVALLLTGEHGPSRHSGSALGRELPVGAAVR